MVKRKDINRSGWDEKKCQGYSKSTQRQCNSYPVHGLTVCRVHGGSSKRAKAAATRNLETEKLTRVARRLGTPHTDLDPAQALLDRVASKAGEVEWLRHQVELLESDGELWWGRTKESEEDNPHGREVRDRPGSPLTHRLHASPQSAGPARPVRHRNTQGWRRREISAHRGTDGRPVRNRPHLAAHRYQRDTRANADRGNRNPAPPTRPRRRRQVTIQQDPPPTA